MLHAYGENGFTFLLFQQIHATAQLAQPFLTNLKHFTNGKTFGKCYPEIIVDTKDESQPEVWLFPNFGKADGFGEPDAIVLHNGFSFWIEVETEFDLIGMKSAAEKALVQLLRFHYLSQVLRSGSVTRPKGKPHFAFVGPTIGSNGNAKLGVLRVAGNRVLNHISEKVAESAKSEKDHYVLLSIQKMKGISKQADGRGSELCSLFAECVSDVHPKITELAALIPQRDPPSAPTAERFWYQYFNGDLERRVDLELHSGCARYVPRKSS